MSAFVAGGIARNAAFLTNATTGYTEVPNRLVRLAGETHRCISIWTRPEEPLDNHSL